MSREVHVRFCESQGLQCPWPLTHNKHTRAACERAARQRYASPAKKSSGKGKR